MASSKAGFAMGVRQALGLVFAEVWFEIKDAIPQIFKDKEENFTLDKFLNKLKVTALKIWDRVKTRFKDILEEF
ncbi:cobalamin adenosyltransferase, partial [Escherichia coli]|nr:cobalamin adenosyltransferase [Escherichia coli]